MSECLWAVVRKTETGEYEQVSGFTDYEFAQNYAKELRKNWGGTYYVWDDATVVKNCRVKEGFWE